MGRATRCATLMLSFDAVVTPDSRMNLGDFNGLVYAAVRPPPTCKLALPRRCRAWLCCSIVAAIEALLPNARRTVNADLPGHYRRRRRRQLCHQSQSRATPHELSCPASWARQPCTVCYLCYLCFVMPIRLIPMIAD